MSQEANQPVGTTYRTKCGRGRATFESPSSMLPWSVVLDGSVIRYEGYKESAERWFARNGFRLNPNPEPMNKAATP